jgi:hypothetical protein
VEAEPLPQTRRIGAVDLTLESLHLWDSSQSIFNGRPSTKPIWAVRPQFTLRHQGEKISSALDINWEFLDATGNPGKERTPLSFREPAWKIRAEVSPNGDYPFSDDEGLALGPVPMPGPGEYQVLPVPANEVQQGLRFAALFGEGRYLWRDGAFVPVPPARDGESFTDRVDTDPTTAMHVRATEPVLVILFGFTKSTRAGTKWETIGRSGLLQTTGRSSVVQITAGKSRCGLSEEDQEWWLTPSAREAGAAGSFRIPQHNATFAPGTSVSIRIVPVKPETIEFLVAPPPAP